MVLFIVTSDAKKDCVFTACVDSNGRISHIHVSINASGKLLMTVKYSIVKESLTSVVGNLEVGNSDTFSAVRKKEATTVRHLPHNKHFHHLLYLPSTRYWVEAF